MSEDDFIDIKKESRKRFPSFIENSTIFRDHEMHVYEAAPKDKFLKKLGRRKLTVEEKQALNTEIVPLLDLNEQDRVELVDVGKQLPLFLENSTMQANLLLRSALFQSRSDRKKRKYYTEWEPIISLFNDSCLISYRGSALTQWDHYVLLKLIQIRGNLQIPIDEPIPTSSRQILLGSKSQLNKVGYEKVKNSLERLYSARLRITDRVEEKHIYARLLSGEMLRCDKTTRWVVSLNPSILGLLYPDNFTYLNLSIFTELRCPIAKWLYCFVSSLKIEKKPIRFEYETLAVLSGAAYDSMKEFKSRLLWAAMTLKEMNVLILVENEDNCIRLQRNSRLKLAQIDFSGKK